MENDVDTNFQRELEAFHRLRSSLFAVDQRMDKHLRRAAFDVCRPVFCAEGIERFSGRLSAQQDFRSRY